MTDLVVGIAPTVSQRDLKSAFWLAFQDAPFADPENITPGLVSQLTGNSSIHKWWNQPGFKEWFLNSNEYEVKLESSKHNALEILEDIAKNPDVNPAIRVQAARAMLDENSRNAKKAAPKEEELSPEQVKEIIKIYAPKFIGGGNDN